MRRPSFRPVVLLTAMVLAVGLALAPGTVAAKGANGAVVIKSGACTLFDGTGTLVAGTKFHAVVHKTRSMARCSAKGLTNTTGKAVRFNFANTGTQCQTPAGLTERWHETLSRKGRATIVCHFP